MIKKDTTAKLSYTSYGVTTSVEFEGSDITLDEVFQAFKAVLVGATFSEEQFINYIIEKGDELSYEKKHEDE